MNAGQEADRLKDEFVSVEHLALAILASEGDAAKVLREHGAGRDELLRTLSAVRGNQRVTSANPEDTYEALEKYGVDLVAQARTGKLDPASVATARSAGSSASCRAKPRTTPS